ncbi:response regulator [Verrucomicrobiota bacterium]
MSILTFTAILEGMLIFIAILLIIHLFIQRRNQKESSELLSARTKKLRSELAELETQKLKSAEKQEWYCSLFNKSKDMVFVYTITEDGLPGVFLDVNDATCTQLNYPREKILGITLQEIERFETPSLTTGYSRSDMVVLSDSYIHDHQKKLATRACRRIMEKIFNDKQILYESILQDRNGKQIPVEIAARCFEIQDHPVVMSTAKNITERLQVEQALTDSQRRFQDFFAQSPIGIAMYDADRKLIAVNLACLKMFGIPDREEFAKFDLFDNPLIPESIKKKLDKGESVRWEATVDFSKVLEKSLFITRKTSTSYFDIMLTNMGPDRDFKSRGYFAQVQDTTERREAEDNLRHSEQQLLQAEKMEAIGSMAGGIAHDFNNILTPIMGYAKMAMRPGTSSENIKKYADGISKAANRAKDLVGQILTFSRKSDQEEHKLNPIKTIPIVKEVIKLQRTSLPENIEIQRVLKTEHDIVMANPTKIHQVIMNLCTNAGHAMRKTNGGILELRMTDFVATKRSKGKFPELEPGRYLRISIKDTGTGMDQATLKKIFEPFFTTKRIGEGTGMGLSVVHGIITSYKGTIKVDTEPGKGSTFHVILPVVEEKTEEETESTEEPPTGNESILIVEDDTAVAEILSEMLISLGYKTTVISNGFSALKLFKLDSHHFDLVIMDQVMHEMKGTELARQLLTIRPDIPIILCTGYKESIPPEQAKAAGIRELITKPLTIEDLSVIIRKVLDQQK